MTKPTRIALDHHRSRSTLRFAGALVLFLAALVGVQAGALAQNASVVRGGGLLPIEAKKGRLLRIKRPVATVFVADPTIADIQVKSPTLLYVFGKRAGEPRSSPLTRKTACL